MSIIDNIIEIKDLVPANVLDNLFHYAGVGSWNLQSSHPKYGNKRFLMMQLNKDLILSGIIDSLQIKLNRKFVVKRVYLNGQFYGMPGCPHTDSDDENEFTLLIYVNPIWDLRWGGQTIFYDKTWNDKFEEITFTDKYRVYYPRRDLSLFFPAKILHYAESPTKDCNELRVTLAYKLGVLE